MSFTMGCDPELFLWDNLKQRIVPAIGKIGGTKWRPLKVDGGMVQLDGTVLEFGIDPASTADEFVNNIQRVINAIQTKLDNRFHGRYSLRCGAMAGYSLEDIAADSPALEVGCSPQFYFTSPTQLQQVDGLEMLDYRRVPVGGHIHFGFGVNMDTSDPRLTSTAYHYLDAVDCEEMFFDIESDYQRDEVMNIGDVTARIKPYGVEFRNPSSFWLADREFCEQLFKYCHTVYMYLKGHASERAVNDARGRLERITYRVEGAAAALPDKYQETLPLDF